MSFLEPQPCGDADLGEVTINNGPGAAAVNVQDGGNSITTDSLAQHAEDDPSVSGDIGVFVLAIRNDSNSNLTTTDGDYSPIAVASDGRLKTRIEYAEDIAHVSGNIGAFILAVRNDAATVLTDANGDYSPISVDSAGRIRTNALGTYSEDGAHVSGDQGLFVLAVRNDNATTALTTTDSDYSPIGVTSQGGIFTAVQRAASATLVNVNDTASSTTLQAANNARRGWLIFNDSSSDLYIKFGATASLTSFSIKLGSGQYYEMPQPIYVGVIDGIWSADSTGAARVTELT